MSAGKRLFICDDEEILRYLGKLLTSQGYAVETFSSGISLLRRFAEPGEGPDLLLQDVRMPDMDGISVLKEVKRLRPSLPVIIMTAFATVDHAVGAMRIGDRQGADCRSHPPPQPPPGAAAPLSQLRGSHRNAAGKSALWACAGGLHRCSVHPERVVGRSRRRHALSGRGWRHESCYPGQTPQGHPVPRISAGGRYPNSHC